MERFLKIIICLFVIVCFSVYGESVTGFTLEEYRFLNKIVDFKNTGERICNSPNLSPEDKDLLSYLYSKYQDERNTICNATNISQINKSVQPTHIFEVLLSQIIYECINLHTSDINNTLVCLLHQLSFLFSIEDARWQLTHLRFQENTFDLLYNYSILKCMDSETNNILYTYLKEQARSTKFIENEIYRALKCAESEVYPDGKNLLSSGYQLVEHLISPFFTTTGHEVNKFRIFCRNVLNDIDDGKCYDICVSYCPKNKAMDGYSLWVECAILKNYTHRNRALVLLWTVAIYEFYNKNRSLPTSLNDISFTTLFGDGMDNDITKNSNITGLPIEYAVNDTCFTVEGGPEYTFPIPHKKEISGKTIYYGSTE